MICFPLTPNIWRNHSLTIFVEGLASARRSLYSAQHMPELHLREEGGPKRKNGGTESDPGGFGLLLSCQPCEGWGEPDWWRRRGKTWVRNTFVEKPVWYSFLFPGSTQLAVTDLQHLPSMQPQFKMQWFWVSSPWCLGPSSFLFLASPWEASLGQSLPAAVMDPNMATLSPHMDQVTKSIPRRCISFHGWHFSGGDPYAEFARRNGVESVAPVIEALRRGKKKYEDEN